MADSETGLQDRMTNPRSQNVVMCSRLQPKYKAYRDKVQKQKQSEKFIWFRVKCKKKEGGGGRKSKKIQEAQEEHTTTLTTDVKRD